MEILRSYFGPEAADAISYQVMRFTHYRRADLPIDENIAEFDPLRRKAKSRMQTGAIFREQFISISRMNNAGLPRKGKSLALASSRKSLKFEDVSANTRRVFGSRGGKGCQDALLTEEADGLLESDKDLEGWMAYRKPKKKGVGMNKKDGAPKREGDKVRGGKHVDWFELSHGEARQMLSGR